MPSSKHPGPPGVGEARQPTPAASGTSPWEWAISGLGVLLILSGMGYLAFYGLTHPDQPPRLNVAVEEIAPSGDQYLVLFSAINRGNATAAHVHVEGTLSTGPEVVEHSEVIFDFVPEHSTRDGGTPFRA